MFSDTLPAFSSISFPDFSAYRIKALHLLRKRRGHMKLHLVFLATLAAFNLVPAQEIQWQPWSDSVFSQAKQEGRFVLLDLGTGWCHWCHVMDNITYRDPAVVDVIRKHYLAVRVDADLRPDLANLYEDYGWPATIVFNVDGSEIVTRRGYIPPMPMASMLENIIDDPSPGPSVVPEQKLTNISQAFLSSNSRDQLRQRLVDTCDSKNSGWGTIQKFLAETFAFWNDRTYLDTGFHPVPSVQRFAWKFVDYLDKPTVLDFLDRRGIANLDANRFSLFSLDLAGQSIV